ncbi:KilA-N domain-containing protein [Pseudoduganella sp. R-32]|uniref:KilA-N domain-containing protein n=1 Tax=Pseudoduganella sp. R-32 TaxID=3404061 RepID=UPI003CF033F2
MGRSENNVACRHIITPSRPGRCSQPSAVFKGRTHAGEWEYNGKPVQFTGDGWFNATEVAKRFDKRLDNWLANDETQAYLSALGAALNTWNSRDLIRVKRGRYGGTWLHPKLAVAFARWLDIRFAVWCDMQIDNILRGGLTLWHKSGRAPSETPDREALLAVVAAVVARHRLSFRAVYDALNRFAGVTHAREMNCEQVIQSAEFGARLLAGNATPDDFARVEQCRADRNGESLQLMLPFLSDVMAGGAQ